MAERKGTMTETERLRALLQREKPDRIPVSTLSIGFASLYTGGTIADAYNNPELALSAQRQANQDFGWIDLSCMGPGSWGAWEFGGEVKWPSGDFSQAPTIARCPVDTPEEAMKLELPDVKTAGSVPMLMDFYRMAWVDNKVEENPVPYGWFCGPFTLAGNICGIEKFCRWLLRAPEAAHRLLRLATDFDIELSQYYKDNFGGMLIQSTEPSTANQLISPGQFEKFALPYLIELNEKMIAMGHKCFQHICGEQNLNLPHWAKVPMGNPGVCSFGHEVDLETAAEYFPNDIIYGNIEPAILQTQTPDEVYEISRKLIEQGKKAPGGFIFGTGCELAPRAKPENLRAMTQAANDFGWL